MTGDSAHQELREPLHPLNPYLGYLLRMPGCSWPEILARMPTGQMLSIHSLGYSHMPITSRGMVQRSQCWFQVMLSDPLHRRNFFAKVWRSCLGLQLDWTLYFLWFTDLQIFLPKSLRINLLELKSSNSCKTIFLEATWLSRVLT